MKNIAHWLGLLSAVTRLLLAALVAASGLIMPSTLPINSVGAMPLAVVSLLQWWRVRAMKRVSDEASAGIVLNPLHRVDIATSAAMSVTGATLLSGASMRVFVEGTPVFG